MCFIKVFLYFDYIFVTFFNVLNHFVVYNSHYFSNIKTSVGFKVFNSKIYIKKEKNKDLIFALFFYPTATSLNYFFNTFFLISITPPANTTRATNPIAIGIMKFKF